MTDAPLLVDAIGLGRVFNDGTKALDRATFTIRDGSFTAIVGPSGCGKSTLLRVLAGLDFATAGTLDWPSGQVASAETGYVFQEPTLMPWASVRDNIYLPLRLAGISKAEAAPAIDDVIKLVDLENFAESRPQQLSGGMKMRVSIARALVRKPRLLLMDEPFGALDEITRFRLNDELLKIVAGQGCTVVFVTHSVFEAAYLAENVLVMTGRPGRISRGIPIAYDAPREAALRNTESFAAKCGVIAEVLKWAAE